jgi:hypothetical protein
MEAQIAEARKLAEASRLGLTTPLALNHWFNQAHPELFKKTPLELLLSGHGEHVLQYLRRQAK